MTENATGYEAETPEGVVAMWAAATDVGLMGLLDAALAGGSADQARAVLAVAHNRGAAAVVSAYLDRAPDATAGLYSEYLEAPGSAELEKHEAQAETFVHDPEPGMLRYGPPAA